MTAEQWRQHAETLEKKLTEANKRAAEATAEASALRTLVRALEGKIEVLRMRTEAPDPCTVGGI